MAGLNGFRIIVGVGVHLIDEIALVHGLFQHLDVLLSTAVVPTAT